MEQVPIPPVPSPPVPIPSAPSLANKLKQHSSGVNWSELFFRIIIFILLLFVIMAGWATFRGYSYIRDNKKEINKNWPKYRCNPYVLPFAGWAIGPKSVSSTANAIQCMALNFNTYLATYMSPVYRLFQWILDLIWSVLDRIEGVRQMINYMRKSILDSFRDTSNMLYNIYRKVASLVRQLWSFFSVLFDAFKNIFEALAFGIFTVISVWNGPIGGVGRFWCFRPTTYVQLENYKIAMMKDLQPGMILEGNNKVIAVLRFDGYDVPVYSYPVSETRRVIVSGVHLVKEDDVWLPVKESRKAVRIYDEEEELICLVTEKGSIPIDNVLFADWLESSNSKDTTWLRDHVISLLNKETPLTQEEISDRAWGIHPSHKIKLQTGEEKTLREIEIGDILEVGGRVNGIIKTSTGETSSFSYRHLRTSGDLIVLDKDETWRPVRFSSEGKKEEDEYDCRLIHLVTTDGVMEVEGVQMRDYRQVVDEGMNEEIDKEMRYRFNLKQSNVPV